MVVLSSGSSISSPISTASCIAVPRSAALLDSFGNCWANLNDAGQSLILLKAEGLILAWNSGISEILQAGQDFFVLFHRDLAQTRSVFGQDRDRRLAVFLVQGDDFPPELLWRHLGWLFLHREVVLVGLFIGGGVVGLFIGGVFSCSFFQ